MMKRKVLLEICCGCLEDAVLAEAGGADRIELNSGLFLGGLTPSLGTLIEAKKHLRIPVLPMVRPRAAGFFYSDWDMKTMIADARLFIDHGADGLVFGFLNEDGTLDARRTEQLVRLADGRQAVFHRAFDVTPDPFKTLDQLIELGVTRVLTSGQAPTVLEGADLIAQLVNHAQGRIEILPGGGISLKNIAEILRRTGVAQIHAAFLAARPEPSTSNNAAIYYGGALYPPEDRYEVADLAKIKSVATLIE